VNDIVYLLDWWRWFGKHSSYGLLPQHIERLDHSLKVITTEIGVKNRFGWMTTTSPIKVLSRLLWIMKTPDRRPWRTSGYYPGSERVFLDELQRRAGCIAHILYFERHHLLLNRWREAPPTMVVTLHHPPAQQSQFHPSFFEDLRRVHSGIILYQRDLEYFQRFVRSKKLTFIHHGVDTEFFRPGEYEFDSPKRLLFVGLNGRDVPTLGRVLDRLSRDQQEFQFDMVVQRAPEALLKVRRHPNVVIHTNVSDDELRLMYQRSYLLVLPLVVSGANNAIVEALASGVPPITTDVGGIRDYGGDSIYPVVAAGDDSAMARLIEEYLHDQDRRKEVAHNCRAFAERHLAWPVVAQKHLEFYRSLR
jgi:glycosyltransferase involved in cell wall biosynthesis